MHAQTTTLIIEPKCLQHSENIDDIVGRRTEPFVKARHPNFFQIITHDIVVTNVCETK